MSDREELGGGGVWRAADFFKEAMLSGPKEASSLEYLLAQYKTKTELRAPVLNVAFRRAAHQGDLENLQFFIDYGADINGKSSNGRGGVS